MRKIVIAVMGTLSTVVLAISFDASVREDSVTTTADHGAAAGDGDSPDSGDAAGAGTGGGDGSTDGSTDGASPTQAGDAGTPQSSASSDPGAGAGDHGPTSSAPPTATSKSYTGAAVQTRWGVVQVKITVKSGRITKAKALQYPQENDHDRRINSWAIPQLQQMTVENQGRIDSLSGATVTSDGYRESLQSALDKAHLR